jgi:hypothetical protein
MGHLKEVTLLFPQPLFLISQLSDLKTKTLKKKIREAT